MKKLEDIGSLRGYLLAAFTPEDLAMTKRPTPFGTNTLVDAVEIAGYLGCSPKHVRRLAERGQLPRPVKVGRLSRWPREAIERWLQSRI